MGMLDRYRKSGGFLQLLNLIETCGPKKQERFLTIIENEDWRWSEALKRKILTVERIFSWDEMALAEVIPHIQDLTVGVVFHGLKEEQREKATKTLAYAAKRRIDDVFESKNPTQDEISSSYMRLISEVRKLITDGYLPVDKFDPDLHVEADIEEKLAGHDGGMVTSKEVEAVTKELRDEVPFSGEGPEKQELELLKKKFVTLRMEKEKLTEENSRLKDRMDEIKKLAG